MNRILMITRPIAPPWDEASKNFAYNIAQGIKTSRITMLTPGNTPELAGHITQLPLYSSKHLSVGQKIRLIRLYPHRNDFDIIHFMLTPNKLNAYTAKRIFKKGQAKTIQTVATLRDDLYDKKTLKKILFADIIVTYSNYAKRKLEQLGFTNVIKIYPGIDFDRFKPADKDVSMCRQFGITAKDFVITYPGEYTRLGVTDQLIDLLPDLAKHIPNFKFVFACRIKNNKDEQKKAQIKEHIAQQGLQKHVVYTDTVDDMAKLYNMSDVVLFPVRNMVGKFDVPLSILEAMACAKPVIVTDIPILAEFTNSHNSIVVPQNDLSTLLDKLKYLYESPDERQKIGNNARMYVTSSFDVTTSRKEYEKVYESLAPPQKQTRQRQPINPVHLTQKTPAPAASRVSAKPTPRNN